MTHSPQLGEVDYDSFETKTKFIYMYTLKLFRMLSITSNLSMHNFPF